MWSLVIIALSLTAVLLRPTIATATGCDKFGFSEKASVKAPKLIGRISRSQDNQTILYFMSQNSANWETSIIDCENFFGKNASLLSIESQEELARLNEILLRSDDTASTYWLSGRFDMGSFKFKWTNGIELGSWSVWDTGHPNSYSENSRIMAFTVDGLKLRTQMKSVCYRYICELMV